MTIPLDKIQLLKTRLKESENVTYCLQTFGCQMNQADSEKIQMILGQSGLQWVEDPLTADVVIFNTCSVRQKGEDRVFGIIEKIKRNAKKQKREVYVGLTGCMARKTGVAEKYLPEKRERKRRQDTIELLDTSDSHSIFNSDDRLFTRTKQIDFIFRIEEVAVVPKQLSILLGKDIGSDDGYQDYLQVKQSRTNPASANIIIQTGCDNYCSFCIVPYTRGGEISRDEDEIYNEVVEAVKNGAKEITLLGQNVNSYGKQRYTKLWNPDANTWNNMDVKTPFRTLLEKLDSIDWLKRIRFTSSNPHDMTYDILDAHFDLHATCNYLHFALQSGDNEMLQKMNRKHTYEDFKKQVQYLRDKDPLFSISTDIIVGFPGETEEMFENTVKAFRELDFDFAYNARYSSRKGTVATKFMTDDIDHKTKAYRWDKLNTELLHSIQRRNKLMLGRTEEVMVTKIEKDKYIGGRTRNFKEVFVNYQTNIAIGDIITIKIADMDDWVLRGNIVK